MARLFAKEQHSSLDSGIIMVLNGKRIYIHTAVQVCSAPQSFIEVGPAYNTYYPPVVVMCLIGSAIRKLPAD